MAKRKPSSRRIAKKVAKRFLDTGDIRFKYVLGVDDYHRNNGQTYVEELIVPGRIRSQIRLLAERRGWDGYWADNPLVLSIEEG